jgi:hypothetical protein
VTPAIIVRRGPLTFGANLQEDVSAVPGHIHFLFSSRRVCVHSRAGAVRLRESILCWMLAHAPPDVIVAEAAPEEFIHIGIGLGGAGPAAQALAEFINGPAEASRAARRGGRHRQESGEHRHERRCRLGGSDRDAVGISRVRRGEDRRSDRLGEGALEGNIVAGPGARDGGAGAVKPRLFVVGGRTTLGAHTTLHGPPARVNDALGVSRFSGGESVRGMPGRPAALGAAGGTDGDHSPRVFPQFLGDFRHPFTFKTRGKRE